MSNEIDFEWNQEPGNWIRCNDCFRKFNMDDVIERGPAAIKCRYGACEMFRHAQDYQSRYGQQDQEE